MYKINSSIQSLFFILFSSTILFLSIDFLFGSKIQKYFNIPNSIETVDKKYRASHSIYHHTLINNFSGDVIWSGKIYKTCTNQFGFRKSCFKENDRSKYDIIFIGDSYTEAVGVHYKDSFVDLIDNHFEDTKIGNMGVVSYSPSIYLKKVEYFVDQGMSFKDLIVYVDPSDVIDEISRSIINDKVFDNKDSKIKNIKSYTRRIFPNAYLILNKIRHLGKQKINNDPLDYNYFKSSWSYSNELDVYTVEEINTGIEKSIDHMNKLYLFLKKNNIRLSIAIYPHPAQVLHEINKSKHEMIWENFCIKRCHKFINSFDTFRNLRTKKNSMTVVLENYIENDVHFNENGHLIAANDFIEAWEK